MNSHLSVPQLRTRFMDLSFSLYESLSDLLADLVVLDSDEVPDDDMSAALKRVNTASMNCLGDIKLLEPILISIRRSLTNSPVD